MKRLSALFVAAVLFVLGDGGAPARAGEEVAEQFDCASCHTERLTEFRRRRAVALVEHDPEPSLPTGQQPEVSTPDMCWSCHDGYVMDSRSLWTSRHQGHPIGVEPPADMSQLPAVASGLLPLNADGRVYCGSCHSAHFESDAQIEAPTFMRVGIESGNLCVECHADKSSVSESVHVRQSRRRRGHIADFEARGACARCHVAHEPEGPVLWAQEPGDGDMPVEPLCRSCHKSDAPIGFHPADILAWSANVRRSMVDDEGEPMPVFDAEHSQDSHGSIGCGTCHDPHRQSSGGSAGSTGKFLRRSATPGFLCADCHGASSIYRYQFFHAERPPGVR